MDRIVLGIGGYVGSGKSLAGKFFETKGALFLDADQLVHELYRPLQEGHRKLVNYFGERFLRKDGQVDRAKLGKFVFNDVNKLKILNNLMHPLVANEVQKRLDASHEKVVVIEASYFEEKYLGRFVDALLWIECPENTLRERVLGRSGMSEEYFKNILKTQVRPEKVDYVIDNNGSIEKFYIQLEHLWQKLI